jgi:hypothetical protein
MVAQPAPNNRAGENSKSVIDPNKLLVDTKTLVRTLSDDLRANANSEGDVAEVVELEYGRAISAGRTSLSKTEWAEGLYAQVSVAWVLGAVFVRFCEDNGLVPEPLLSGPGGRRTIALDHRTAYFQTNPAHDDRHWLREIYMRYQALPATGDVFGGHNPVWLLAPSADGASSLVQSFQAVDPDTGEITNDFADPTWDTRFLGDLYQDLSEYAKKFYALLQTPIFVEEFILDRTLEPALATFGLHETTVIDATCGSGHFLLGAFERLFERWCDAEPATNRRELARRSLEAIGGIDLNPFAASIARFRLLTAALRAGGDNRLADAPAYPINVAVGDSLLHGDPPGRLAGTINDEAAAAAAHGYATEDVEQVRDLLSRSWHVVVGNPPYITVKDPALNALYRSRYKSCHRQYSLGVPFTERFFQLARRDSDSERSGFVGMITANSFMKREFGKKLIEQWVPVHDLTHVIDTSGAYIPGHGTPTVILFGRNRVPVSSTVRAVMGIRGEPSSPSDPSQGLVWSSIVELIDEPGSYSDYISVIDLDRSRLVKHPWSIGGGGASELKEIIDSRRARRLGDVVEAISTVSKTREDDAYFAPRRAWQRFGVPSDRSVPSGYGTVVRDYRFESDVDVLFPYDESLNPTLNPEPILLRILWQVKQHLLRRRELGGFQVDVGKTWFEWNRFLKHRFEPSLGIAFAFVATHNHFVMNRERVAFTGSAPVIKLPGSPDERQYLELLGVLNSSTACFWMKQVFTDKGNGGIGGGIGDEKWEPRYEHDGTKLLTFPLPRELDPTTATMLDKLAQEMSHVTPLVIADTATPTVERFLEAERRYEELRTLMIAAQERLDWETYRQYGLIDEDLTTGDELEPQLQLGERAFEIVLARKMAMGEVESSWFVRHGSTPITGLPTHWPDSYKWLVERRIEVIETDLNIGLIERPEYKRRWATKSWDDHAKLALRKWLLDRLESEHCWPQPPAITTTARLAAMARTDIDFVQVARLYAGRDDIDVASLTSELMKAEAVPYLAAHRYRDSGLRKYTQWLETWVLQRREDSGEDVGAIPVPPKYTSADYLGFAWDHRGKLDVPKERFVSYPGAERETDASLPVGWAGWDHLARARALATLYLQAKRDGRDVAHLTPLLAGLAELVPWLKQWYDASNPDPALDRPGTQIARLVDAELRAHSLTAADLHSWRPETSRRGRRRV